MVLTACSNGGGAGAQVAQAPASMLPPLCCFVHAAGTWPTAAARVQRASTAELEEQGLQLLVAADRVGELQVCGEACGAASPYYLGRILVLAAYLIRANTQAGQELPARPKVGLSGHCPLGHLACKHAPGREPGAQQQLLPMCVCIRDATRCCMHLRTPSRWQTSDSCWTSTKSLSSNTSLWCRSGTHVLQGVFPFVCLPMAGLLVKCVHVYVCVCIHTYICACVCVPVSSWPACLRVMGHSLHTQTFLVIAWLTGAQDPAGREPDLDWAVRRQEKGAATLAACSTNNALLCQTCRQTQ